jgi:LysM repeat protein
MKAFWMSLTFALVCGGPVFAKSELELLRERRAELDRKIQQLEQRENRSRETTTPKMESAAPSTPAAPASKEEGRIYVVRKGDTLERISRKTRVSVAKLEELNQLKASTVIHIGQKLKLPAPAVTESRPKETKPKEASADVKNAVISPATQTISNPSSGSASMPANSPRSKATSKSDSKSEAKAPVQKTEAGNDKLVIHSVTIQNPVIYSEFASKHGTTTERLNELNGLSLGNSQLLAVGSELYVPAQP